MGLRLYRKLSNLFHPYNAEKYWGERGKVYLEEFQYDNNFIEQERMLLRVLQTMEFNSVLEFGCGFGRITKLIADNFNVKTYHAFDLSLDQINNAKQNCSGRNIIFSVSTIRGFESSMKYDLVIGSEVLLHVTPMELPVSVSHMLGFADKYFVTIDPYKINTKVRANHDFIHNYKELFSNHKANDYKIESAGQAIWVVEK